MKNILKKVLIASLLIAGIYGLSTIAMAAVTYKVPTPIALYEDSLQSAITSSATSFTLVRGTDIVGTSLAASTYGFIIDEGSASQEFVLADCTATACTNALRGVSPITGLTEVTVLKKAHRRGAIVKMTDAPILLILKRLINGDETIPNIISYVSHPTFTTNTQIVDKKYVDDVAISGAPDASTSTKGVTRLSTAPASPTIPIAVGDNDPRVPTQAENDAMVGTSGTPSSTNKFATNDDTSTAVDQVQTTQNGSSTVGEADATTKHAKLAQSFIANKTSMTGVVLNKQADTGSFTGTVTVSLQADTTGSPSGSALATVTLSNATWLATPVGAFGAIFGTPYTTVDGTTYWIVIETSTTDNSNHPNVGHNTAGGYLSGSAKFRNTTDGWTAIATIDLYFEQLTTLVSKINRYDANGLTPGKYLTDTGSTDAYYAVARGITAYTTGQEFSIKVVTANTGTATLNINGLGAKTIVKGINTTLSDGDIAAGMFIKVIYDGTNFVLQNPTANIFAGTTSTSGVSAGPATSSTQTITHGLGRVPSIIRLDGIGQFSQNLSGSTFSSSHGTYNATGNRCIYIAGVNGSTAPTSSTSFAVYVDRYDGSAGSASGVVGNVTSTSFDIVWTVVSNSMTVTQFIWEAE